MAMETAIGVEHSTDAAAATTENCMHPRREYDKVESEASVGVQAGTGPALEEEVYGATQHSVGLQREEGGDQVMAG